MHPPKNELQRMWINQPSKLQPLHHLHGRNVLAHHEYDTEKMSTWRVYFLEGDIVSSQVDGLWLSRGWVGPSVRDAAERRSTVKHYGRIYACMASFPDTDEGRDEANAFMQANPGVSLLCIENGRAYLAHEDDVGVEEENADFQPSAR